MTQQLPPHDVLAERAVLGSVFIRPALLPRVVRGLEADDFMVPFHRDVFAALGEVEADPIVVCDRLKVADPTPLMEIIASVPTAENVRHYVRIVREKAMQRRLLAIAAQLQSRMQLGVGAAELATSMASEAAAVLARLTPTVAR